MTQEFREVACPFCGLACDDITLRIEEGEVSAVDAACPRGQALFKKIGSRQGTGGAWIKGQEAPRELALKTAFEILQASKNPLFGGFSTDVLGARALLALADRVGAVVDHMNSESKLKNLKTVQDLGWITTTLGEVKSRADVIVVVGTDIVTRFPRFFDRFVAVEESLFIESPQQRKIIFIGDELPPPGTLPSDIPVQHIAVAKPDLVEASAVLRGLARGSLPEGLQTTLPLEELKAAHEAMRNAHYGVVVWVAPDLYWDHAELTIQSLTGWVAELNSTTRAAGLPLGGSEGDFSSDGVLIWQSGYPYRTSFASGTAHYDPLMLGSERLLATEEVDCLLWIASFDPEKSSPPQGRCPKIALTAVGAPVLPDVDVQITVATPGVDAPGYYFRADKVVTLPLKPCLEREWPNVTEIATQWLEQLGEASC